MASPTRFTPDMEQAYLRSGAWAEVTQLDLMRAHAASRPDAIAVVDPELRLSWRQIQAAVQDFASRLASLGLECDTPVVVQLPNRAENCVLQLALKRVGLLGAYVPVVWQRAEMEAVIEALRPGALVVQGSFRGTDLTTMARTLRERFPALRLVVVGPTDDNDWLRISIDDVGARGGETGDSALPDDLAYGPFEVTKLVVTSGSTGVPKIVERPEQQQLLWGKGVAELLHMTADDHVGGFVPLSGGPGYFTTDSWVHAGTRLVLSDGFGPETLLPLVERERLSILMTAPAILAHLVEAPALDRYDLRSLRVVRTGSAHLAATLAAEAEDKLGCVVVNAGGSMETCSFGHMSLDDPPEIRHSSVLGKAFPGGEPMIVDHDANPLPPGQPGELWMRGPATSSGYFRDPAATEQAWGALGADGWFRTGDVAKIDGAGYVRLVGRIKDMINRGGMNVYPLELETVLADYPKILEAAVVAIPDPVLGEVPCLCAIPREGMEITLDEVQSFLRSKEFARYKFPERVVTLTEFPRGQTMRINRRLLAEKVNALLGPSDASEA